MRGRPAFPSAGGRPRLAGRLGGGTARCRPRLSGAAGQRAVGMRQPGHVLSMHGAKRDPWPARCPAGQWPASPVGMTQTSRSGLPGPQPGWRLGICRVGAVPQRLCARWAWRGPTCRLSSHVGPWRSMLSLFRTKPQQAGGGEGRGAGATHNQSRECHTGAAAPRSPESQPENRVMVERKHPPQTPRGVPASGPGWWAGGHGRTGWPGGRWAAGRQAVLTPRAAAGGSDGSGPGRRGARPATGSCRATRSGHLSPCV